jgi:hypothetical protein
MRAAGWNGWFEPIAGCLERPRTRSKHSGCPPPHHHPCPAPPPTVRGGRRHSARGDELAHAAHTGGGGRQGWSLHPGAQASAAASLAFGACPPGAALVLAPQPPANPPAFPAGSAMPGAASTHALCHPSRRLLPFAHTHSPLCPFRDPSALALHPPGLRERPCARAGGRQRAAGARDRPACRPAGGQHPRGGDTRGNGGLAVRAVLPGQPGQPGGTPVGPGAGRGRQVRGVRACGACLTAGHAWLRGMRAWRARLRVLWRMLWREVRPVCPRGSSTRAVRPACRRRLPPLLVGCYTWAEPGAEPPPPSRFVVRSCLGGLDDKFVASGSEAGVVRCAALLCAPLHRAESSLRLAQRRRRRYAALCLAERCLCCAAPQVHMWHRASCRHVVTLVGHGSGTVNAVAWSPSDPGLLASASDDHTVRIWGPPHGAGAPPEGAHGTLG